MYWAIGATGGDFMQARNIWQWMRQALRAPNTLRPHIDNMHLAAPPPDLAAVLQCYLLLILFALLKDKSCYCQRGGKRCWVSSGPGRQTTKRTD